MICKPCGPGRRGYHHGNLREALIQAALSLIGEKGPAGFTIAEAARSAGVSPAAPYRHFRDREELMGDVARLGFERFAADLDTAWHGGNPSPLEALQNTGRAYLAFARNEPAYYAAMFETGMPQVSNPALEQAADRAFEVLLKAAATADREADPSRAAARPDGGVAHMVASPRNCLAFRAGEMRAAHTGIAGGAA